MLMRQWRQFEINGIYHVFMRGVDKRAIFKKQQDYARFLLGLYYYNRTKPGPSIWTNIKDRPKQVFVPLSPDPAGSDPAGSGKEPLVNILAFCLMRNHYHLILQEVTEGGISRFMQKMGGYAQYFNKQNNRTGTLFEGRYKAVRVKDNSQLNILFAYVHTNPIEIIEPRWKETREVKNYTKAINYLNNYKWTSYHDYAGNPTFPKIINKDFFIKHFGSEQACREAVLDWVKFKANNYSLEFTADN